MEHLIKPLRFGLSAESIDHLIIFLAHNKLTNNTFNYDFSAKQIKRWNTNYNPPLSIATRISLLCFPPWYI
jgi:hypothetical protein